MKRVFISHRAPDPLSADVFVNTFWEPNSLDFLYGLCTSSGEMITPPIYDHIKTHIPKECELIAACYKGKIGFIDTRGEIKIPFVFDGDRYSIMTCNSGFINGVAHLQIGGYYGAIDKNGDVVIPFIYKKSTTPEPTIEDKTREDIYVRSLHDKFKPSIAASSKASPINNSYYHIYNGKKWGIAYADGSVVVDYLFDKPINEINNPGPFVQHIWNEILNSPTEYPFANIPQQDSAVEEQWKEKIQSQTAMIISKAESSRKAKIWIKAILIVVFCALVIVLFILKH